MRKPLLLVALLTLTAVRSYAAITMTIQSSDANNRLGGVYLGSAIYKPDAVAIYMSQGLQRYAWNGSSWYDDVTPNCYADPSTPGNDARCGDQIGMFWKHVSCTGVPGNSFYPCDANEHWNAYSGSDNIPSALPQPNVWPRDAANHNSMTGFAPLNYQAINAVFPAQNELRSGYESTCHAQNFYSLATAATSPHVTYEPSTGVIEGSCGPDVTGG